MKVRAQFSTLGRDVFGDRYSKECLDKVVDIIKEENIPVLANFYPGSVIGRAVDGDVNEEGAFANLIVRNDLGGKIEEMYLAPAFIIEDGDYNEETKTYVGGTIYCLSFTRQHADKNVKPAEIIEDDIKGLM